MDIAIDFCASTVNLRDMILGHKAKEKTELRDRSEQETNDRRYSHYLERYFYLLLFNAYLSVNINNDCQIKFTEWVRTQKSEVITLLNHMQTNPRNALKIVEDDEIEVVVEKQTEEQEERRVIINRTGDVLLTNTILKADHFPGCQRKGTH